MFKRLKSIIGQNAKLFYSTVRVQICACIEPASDQRGSVVRRMSRRLISIYTPCCAQMIVVLTDGNFAEPGFSNASLLQRTIASLSLDGVIVFFFVLRDDDPIATNNNNNNNTTVSSTIIDPLAELRSFSCLMNSTVTRVSLVDAQRNPLWGIRPYFDYQAGLRMRANRTFWTDTYDDFDGLGVVATVTYPGLEA